MVLFSEINAEIGVDDQAGIPKVSDSSVAIRINKYIVWLEITVNWYKEREVYIDID